MVHNVSAVLGLQEPKVPVHIGHDTQAIDSRINHLRDDGNPMGVEGQLSDPFPCDVGVGQGSALSPILSSIYLSPVMWAFHTERPDTQLIS